MGKYFGIILFFFIFYCCGNNKEQKSNKINDTIKSEIVNEIAQTRDTILTNLKNKIQNNKPLIIHVFIALYGYDTIKYNGMADWADGTNLETNLYWGAGYGLKRYFKQFDNWKTIYNEKNINQNVAERIIFTKQFSNNSNVYLILDAYLGFNMKKCLSDYINAFSENCLDSIKVENLNLPANGNSDLIVFNGHNGLMDYTIKMNVVKCKRKKDAVSICCYSSSYFKEYYTKSSTFPLMTTKGLIPAEGYILGAIIEPWALLKSGDEICQSVKTKYKKIHKKDEGDKADYLFSTNW